MEQDRMWSNYDSRIFGWQSYNSKIAGFNAALQSVGGNHVFLPIVEVKGFSSFNSFLNSIQSIASRAYLSYENGIKFDTYINPSAAHLYGKNPYGPYLPTDKEINTAGAVLSMIPATASLGVVLQLSTAQSKAEVGVVVATSLPYMKLAKGLGGAAIIGVEKVLPSLDATGKVHGTLPKVKDLVKYSKEELEILLKELRQSVQKRIEVTSKMGRDRGHGQRQGAEQDLIKSLEKLLEL